MNKRIRFAAMVLFVVAITFFGVSQEAWAGSMNMTTPPPTPVWYEVYGDSNTPVNFDPPIILNTGCSTISFVAAQNGTILTAEPTNPNSGSIAPYGFSFLDCGLYWFVSETDISAQSTQPISLVTGTICFPQPPSTDGYIFKQELSGWNMVLPSFEMRSSESGAELICVSGTPGEYALAVVNLE